MYNLHCKGCIDNDTCQTEERKKNKRCIYYTRVVTKPKKKIAILYGKKCETDTNIYASDWIRPTISRNERDYDNRWREIPMSSMDRSFRDELKERGE